MDFLALLVFLLLLRKTFRPFIFTSVLSVMVQFELTKRILKVNKLQFVYLRFLVKFE